MTTFKTAVKKNWLTIIGAAVTAVLVIICIQSGIFTSQEKLELLLNEAGPAAPILFVLLQIVQIVIPVIPGGVSCVIGVVVFGPVFGFIYNYLGIIAGSVISFILAKKYGKAFILKAVSEKNYEKYISWIQKGTKFDYMFALALLLPFAPDDLLCMIAGLTHMSLKKVTLILVLCKPLTIASYSVGLPVLLSWISSLF